MRYVSGMHVLLYAILFGTAAVFASGADHAADNSQHPELLFAISAKSGSLEGDTLTLDGVPNVVYFSDRPARAAGHMSIADFIEFWSSGSESVKNDPPNATLSMMGDHGTDEVVLELSGVSLEGDDIAFTIRVIRGKVHKEFGESSLFIDGIRG